MQMISCCFTLTGNLIMPLWLHFSTSSQSLCVDVTEVTYSLLLMQKTNTTLTNQSSDLFYKITQVTCEYQFLSTLKLSNILNWRKTSCSALFCFSEAEISSSSPLIQIQLVKYTGVQSCQYSGQHNSNRQLIPNHNSYFGLF